MRCPDCSKFVPFDTDLDPEINAEVDEDGNITGDVRIVNACGECGTELTENTFDIDTNVTDEYHAHLEATKDEGNEHGDLSLDDDGGSRTDETQTIDRHGKPIKSARYMKRLYGAEVTFTVTCACGETFTANWKDNVSASGMESMV